MKCANKCNEHIPSSISTTEKGDVEILWAKELFTATGVKHDMRNVVIIEKVANVDFDRCLSAKISK